MHPAGAKPHTEFVIRTVRSTLAASRRDLHRESPRTREKVTHGLQMHVSLHTAIRVQTAEARELRSDANRQTAGGFGPYRASRSGGNGLFTQPSTALRQTGCRAHSRMRSRSRRSQNRFGDWKRAGPSVILRLACAADRLGHLTKSTVPERSMCD